jgi:hypothetical protein
MNIHESDDAWAMAGNHHAAACYSHKQRVPDKEGERVDKHKSIGSWWRTLCQELQGLLARSS